ncbi:DUF3367 domain-containing protein [Nonomuraea sediminis]|uniref:DUF3367 domain-containing protein n=1 Tax=Nonomuraea sediminis TaxID=2835864 RepID=UPI001BDD25AC|nr:DUF3367 domain-containing protein [Nonomuraea sediminis]
MPSLTRVAPVLGLALGLLALGPGLGRGFVLLQDMVFVPSPAFSPFTFGLAGGAARVVPSDAVVTLLAHVLPAELVQKLLLLAIFVLGCAGAARLGGLVAGAFYVWNPYVAERLLMGQWALLLGYAGLPWVVHAMVRGRRLWAALLPAAVGGFAAMLITGLTAVPLIGMYGRAVRDRWRGALVVVGLLVAFSLPWLVPTALRPEGLTGDPAGVDAFAARPDGPLGVVASLLSLGGIWNAYAVPEGFGSVVGSVARLAVAVAGIAGFWLARRDLPYARGLGVAAALGFAIACLGVTEPGRDALRWLVGAWGGFAVVRDAQQFLAPLALLAAVGLGQLTARVPGRGWVAALVVVPVLVLPTMAWGLAGRLAAVPYPDSWERARAVIARDGEPGDVLVLPFESYRRFGWNGGRAVLDPAQRFFATPGRRVVASDVMRVGSARVGSEDPRARKVEHVLEGVSPDLAAAGFRYVLVDAGTPEELQTFTQWLKGAQPVVDAAELRLYRLAGPVARVSSE